MLTLTKDITMSSKLVTVIKRFSQDSCEFSVVEEIFNRIVSENDFYTILEHYDDKPDWLNLKLFKDGYYKNNDTLDEYIITELSIIDLGD